MSGPTGILRKACYCRKRVQQPEGGNDTPARAPSFRQHRIIPALRLKHRSDGSPRQEPPQAAVALRSASLRLGVRHGICVAKMLDNVGLRYPHRASGAKAPRTLRPLPLLRFAASATGGAHLCSTKYYLRFWLSSCHTSLAVSALRIMRYCLYFFIYAVDKSRTLRYTGNYC